MVRLLIGDVKVDGRILGNSKFYVCVMVKVTRSGSFIGIQLFGLVGNNSCKYATPIKRGM